MDIGISGERSAKERSAMGSERAEPNAGRRLETLSNLALAINTGSALDNVMAMAVEGLVSGLDGSSGSLFLLSPDGSSLKEVAEWGLKRDPFNGVSFDLASSPPSRQVIEGLRPAYFTAKGLGLVKRATAKKYDIEGCLMVPIVADSRSIGLAYVNYRDLDSQPAEEDNTFARAIAALCALAIQKGQLRDEKKELDHFKDEFLSDIAHALKSPLTALKGYTQLLLRKAAKHPERDDFSSLEAIETQSNRILNAVNKLVDVGRIELGRLELSLEPVELVSLVGAAVDQARANVYKHELVMEADSDRVMGNWDRKALGRVVAGLLDNAVRYSPRGGRIEVRVGCLDGRAEVSVRDCGIGIAKEEQDHIFDRYFRSKEADDENVGGIGLSLYVAKGIIESHGGRIWVESEPDKGSTFSISLPLKIPS